MTRLILILLVMLLSATGSAKASDADDCILNPAAFHEMLKKLRQHYAKSRYSKDHSAVIIRLADGDVTVTYGGCEYFSTEISYVSATKKRYSTQEAFTRAKELLRRFGQRVDLKLLERLWTQKKYEQDPPGYFEVAYPDLHEFTLDFRSTGGHAHIDISFYN